MKISRRKRWLIGTGVCVLIVIVASTGGQPDLRFSEVNEINPHSHVKIDSAAVKQLLVQADKNVHAEREDGCAFNSDFKGLTTAWLEQLNIHDFKWKEKLAMACVASGNDSIFVSEGGCEHYGKIVELRLSRDSHLLSDSAFWIDKALQLAHEFQLDDYVEMINDGRLRRIQTNESSVWYEMEDMDLSDNLYYNGIEITVEQQSKRISISQYLN
jgi:hypothetical protein